MTPAEQIKAIRKDHGLTQQGLSDSLNIPKRTIENWEAGVRVPPEYVIELIKTALQARKGKNE